MNAHASVLLGEVIACILVAAERTHQLETPHIQNGAQKLRELVGAKNLNEFLTESKKLWTHVTADSDEITPYLSNTLKEVIKDLNKWLNSDDFPEDLATSLLTPISEKDWIPIDSIQLAADNLVSFQNYADILVARFDEIGGVIVAERIGLPKKKSKKLRKQIQTLSMTMSELRVLCLAMDILVEWDLAPQE